MVLGFKENQDFSRVTPVTLEFGERGMLAAGGHVVHRRVFGSNPDLTLLDVQVPLSLSFGN